MWFVSAAEGRVVPVTAAVINMVKPKVYKPGASEKTCDTLWGPLRNLSDIGRIEQRKIMSIVQKMPFQNTNQTLIIPDYTLF